MLQVRSGDYNDVTSSGVGWQGAGAPVEAMVSPNVSIAATNGYTLHI